MVEVGSKPFSDFIAKRHIVDAADLAVTFARGISHDTSNLSAKKKQLEGYLAEGGHKTRFLNFRA
jgi:hypothetical protein